MLHMKADADIKLFLRRGRRVGAKAFVAWTTLDVFCRYVKGDGISKIVGKCRSRGETYDRASRGVDAPFSLLTRRSDALYPGIRLEVKSLLERLSDEMGDDLPRVQRARSPGDESLRRLQSGDLRKEKQGLFSRTTVGGSAQAIETDF